ncbi:heat shock factor-binding protein 1-like isoform X2 [Brachyhypopomus gauderio]|uniref:heat shock factor-binding protein 1-like isoform X2 n=1 Tax=Brachyhypopomus gauderio TaxID=698409 RepID=UPI004040EAC7
MHDRHIWQAVMSEPDSKVAKDLTMVMETTMKNLQSQFQTLSGQLVSRMDEMGTRIENLEKNVSDLMTQAGLEGHQTTKYLAEEDRTHSSASRSKH